MPQDSLKYNFSSLEMSMALVNERLLPTEPVGRVIKGRGHFLQAVSHMFTCQQSGR